MYATTIPMNIWLPGDVAARAPLNLFAVVVGTSGSGKTGAMSRAEDLLGPVANRDVLMRRPLRSGEGLVTLVNRPKPKGASEDEPVATRVGVHVHYDEGGTLSKQTNQSTTTIIPYLNTCWSGSGRVGGALKDTDSGFEAERVRICALIGVQLGVGKNLFTGEAKILGFPQRLLFLSADGHPEIAHQVMPEVPQPVAPLGLPLLAHHEFTAPHYVTLPREVRLEVWEWSKQTKRDPLDGHAMNLRLRVATVLMLMHGEGEDSFLRWWAASETLMAVHRDVRHALVSSIKELDLYADWGSGEARRVFNLDRGVESLLTKIGDKLVPIRTIKDHFRSWKDRHGIDHRDIVDHAELLGVIHRQPGGIKKS
jgi:hypothetical protein